MTASVCVVGSIHMDFVVRAPRFSRPGETLTGNGFDLHPGGKGANQAVAASRMGATVTLIGCVGVDDWGSTMRGVLTSEGIDLHGLVKSEESATGVGVITVVPGGEHTIIVAPGANALVSADQVDAHARAIRESKVLVLQNEIPLEANLRAAQIAREAEVPVLINGSPTEDFSKELLGLAQLLVVNRDEAADLLGDEEREIAPSGLTRRLASLGPERVVVTLGGEGAVHFNGQENATFEGCNVEAVDTTGAGDAFVGALAALRSDGARLKDAVRLACAAGALACTGAGAISSLPTREAVETLITASVSTN